MNSLVTGGAGFIGSHVAEELIKHGHHVTVLDDLSGGFIENVPEQALFIKGSISDVDLVSRCFEKGNFDYVFHLAAYAAEGLSHYIKHFNYNNNLIGSINLINASINHDVKCFVFTSSIAVYGEGNGVPVTEETLPHPLDPYGISKLAVEMELGVCKDIFDLDYIIFRPHNVYGEHQNIADKYRNVVGIFMNQVMQNKPMTIYGDGEQVRAFSYIGDVAPIIAKSIDICESYNQTFNIGAETPYTVNELAKVVAHEFGKRVEVKHLPVRNEARSIYASHDKLHDCFGVHPKTGLEQGIQQMAIWAKKFGARQSCGYDNIEICKNFPAAWSR